ncbi:MAG: hypothetical protein H6Q72_375 [Firmicutes bacterium]|nr:hypothetical protein [Bacillota bacterium]
MTLFENMEVELTVEEIEELIKNLPRILYELNDGSDEEELA